MNSKDFTYFKLDDETYTFLGKSFKAPKAYPRNGNVDMFTNGAWKNSGKNINEVPDIELEEYELSFGLWMTHLSRLYNTVSSFAADITTPYQLLYQGNHTGFTYKLPYLINQGTIKGPIQNTWGGDETGIGESFAGSFGKNLDRSLRDIGKFFAEGVSYGGAGEKVRRYNSADSVKSITIKFPLYNTIDKDKTLRNFEFVTLFAFQNMKTRTSWMTYLPPKIYKVNTKSFGGINMPAAFVKSFDATAVGTVRKIRYKGFEDILIPEAYDVSITMEELLSESSNIFAVTMGGDPVVVIGNTTNTPRNNININYDSSITPTGVVPIPVISVPNKELDDAKKKLNDLNKQLYKEIRDSTKGEILPSDAIGPNNIDNLREAVDEAQRKVDSLKEQQIQQAFGIQTADGKVFAFGEVPSGLKPGSLTDSSKLLDIGTKSQTQDTLSNNLELPQSFLRSAPELSIAAPAAPATPQQVQVKEDPLIRLQNEPKPAFQDNPYITQRVEIISAAQSTFTDLLNEKQDILNSKADKIHLTRETLGAPGREARKLIVKEYAEPLSEINSKLETARKQLETPLPPSFMPVTQTLKKQLDSSPLLSPIGETSYLPGMDILDGSKTFKVPEQDFSNFKLLDSKKNNNWVDIPDKQGEFVPVTLPDFPPPALYQEDVNIANFTIGQRELLSIIRDTSSSAPNSTTVPKPIVPVVSDSKNR